MITDKTTGWIEPTIIINGETLTFSQAMSVRVAIGSMRISLSDKEYRDKLGLALADGYNDRLLEVEILMHREK